MAKHNFDVARAARAEARGERHVFTFGGRDFTLAPTLPFRAVESISEIGTFEEDTQDPKENAAAVIAMRVLMDEVLGDQAPAFWALHPDLQDVVQVVEWMMPLYGFGDAGESSASGDSSSDTSSPSRPTSVVITGSSFVASSGDGTDEGTAAAV